MRFLTQIALCCLFAGGAMAQRGGGHGGGMGGGGMGGGGFHGGSMGGGFRGGSVGGVRGGFAGNGFRGGFAGNGFRGGFIGSGFRVGFGFRGLGYWPYYGLGFGVGYGGYWPGYYDSGYYPAYPTYDPYSGYASGYAGYNTSPNVTVVYPQQTAPNTVYVERASPVVREYDQYGQEVNPPSGGGSAPGTSASPGGSPIYLIAFQDRVIRAAVAYWVDGKTLHYVTLQHEDRQTPLGDVDRGLSVQLNRERHVPFQLPAQ